MIVYLSHTMVSLHRMSDLGCDAAEEGPALELSDETFYVVDADTEHMSYQR